jgi:hypothetical protein
VTGDAEAVADLTAISVSTLRDNERA